MGLSSFATTDLEDVKLATANEIPLVLQLYVMQNRKTSELLVKKAEKAGYKAIFLTVDTPYLGRRHAETRSAFKLPPHLTLAHFTIPTSGYSTSTSSPTLPISGNSDLPNATATAGPQFGTHAGDDRILNPNDPSLNWTDLAWLRSITSLPIYLKGVLHPADIRYAASITPPVAGIIISNHGGRQLSPAISTLHALEICAPVAEKCGLEIHFDGGVRKGSDVLMALALGAQTVWIGRPVVWGLVVDGQKGVELALRVLREEVVLGMGLLGVRSIKELREAQREEGGVVVRIGRGVKL